MHVILLPLVFFFHLFGGLARGNTIHIDEQSTHKFVYQISNGVDAIEMQTIKGKLRQRIRLFTQRHTARLVALDTETLSPSVLRRGVLNCVREFVDEHGFEDIYAQELQVMARDPRPPAAHPVAQSVANSLIGL